MADQIVKQPNGKFLIFSSISDSVIGYNATPEELIEFKVKRAKERITEEVNNIVEKLNKGEKPYYQFTKTYDEVLETVGFNHGKHTRKEIKDAIEKE